MSIVSWVVLGALCAGSGDILENAMPLRLRDAWTVEAGPGTVQAEGRSVTLSEPAVLAIAPAPAVKVVDELYATLPVFNPNGPGWRKGAVLTKLLAQECSATGLLYPESLVVKAAPGDGAAFVLDKDYGVDTFWGTFGRIEGGAIADGQGVFVSYQYSPNRLDRIVAGPDGQVRVVSGTPGVAELLPPPLAEGDVALGNVWVPGRIERLGEDNLYPVEHRVWPDPAPQAEALLPKTLAKLRAGSPVTIVAWGDSVTNGGGVPERANWYQERFAALLQARFPRAAVTILTAAWPGGNSKGYLDAAPGGPYDFVRDVLDPKPDLVTIEFVNDAYLDEAGVQTHYHYIMDRLSSIGAEVILITPHYVRPDWMGVSTLKVDADPRVYVAGLRRFAAEQQVALADASIGWGRLWRQGIPYTTLLYNGINHPDERGHEIFAQALLGVFPAR